MNEELKFLRKLKKNRGVGGLRLVGGFRVNVVNTMLGLGGDVGYEECEPRIEGSVQKGIVQY